MKKMLIVLLVISASGMFVEAADRSCRSNAESNCCTTTRWYKAKDGTFREMLAYTKALSRAEDADNMEIQLKDVQAELAAAKADSELLQADAAKHRTDMESRIAELTKQLESERQIVAREKERGDTAEAAHKMCIEQIADVRENNRKLEDSLKAVQGDLRKTFEERDSLKTARTELEQKLTDMTAAKAAAEEAAKVSQQALEKFKQDAAEAKKAAVQAEEKEKDAANPDADKPAADGGAAPGEKAPGK